MNAFEGIEGISAEDLGPVDELPRELINQENRDLTDKVCLYLQVWCGVCVCVCGVFEGVCAPWIVAVVPVYPREGSQAIPLSVHARSSACMWSCVRECAPVY